MTFFPSFSFSVASRSAELVKKNYISSKHIWQTTSKNCPKVRAARAARLFFHILPIRTFVFWRRRCLRPCLSSPMTTQRQRRKSSDLIGRMRKNNRAARFLAQIFDAVCQTTRGSFHIWDCDDNASSKQWICHSSPLHENPTFMSSKLTLCCECQTWNT